MSYVCTWVVSLLDFWSYLIFEGATSMNRSKQHVVSQHAVRRNMIFWLPLERKLQVVALDPSPSHQRRWGWACANKQVKHVFFCETHALKIKNTYDSSGNCSFFFVRQINRVLNNNVCMLTLLALTKIFGMYVHVYYRPPIFAIGGWAILFFMHVYLLKIDNIYLSFMLHVLFLYYKLLGWNLRPSTINMYIIL